MHVAEAWNEPFSRTIDPHRACKVAVPVGGQDSDDAIGFDHHSPACQRLAVLGHGNDADIVDHQSGSNSLRYRSQCLKR